MLSFSHHLLGKCQRLRSILISETPSHHSLVKATWICTSLENLLTNQASIWKKEIMDSLPLPAFLTQTSWASWILRPSLKSLSPRVLSLAWWTPSPSPQSANSVWTHSPLTNYSELITSSSILHSSLPKFHFSRKSLERTWPWVWICTWRMLRSS